MYVPDTLLLVEEMIKGTDLIKLEPVETSVVEL
jgi:hypothetical protein